MTVIGPFLVLSQGQHLTLCSLKLGLHFTDSFLCVCVSVTVLLGPRNCGLLWESGWQGKRLLASCLLAVLSDVTPTISSLQHQPLVSDASFLPTSRIKAHQSPCCRNSLLLSPLWFQITSHELSNYLEPNPLPSVFLAAECAEC